LRDRHHSSGARTAGPRRRRRVALLPTLAALVVVGVTASLGNWQMRRAAEKAALQAQRTAAQRDAPLSIPAQPIDPASLDGRRVAVRGQYDASRTVFIDNRTYRGVAGFHVVAPVKIQGSDLHVLVLRGWVAGDPRDRARLPQVRTPEGEVLVTGLAQADLGKAVELKAAAPPAAGERLWQNLDLQRYERWSGLKLQPLVLRQIDSPVPDDGLVRDWPSVAGDEDKHRGYAFQWYAMAALTAGLWVYFTISRRRDDGSETS